jgi:hypothetical protein
VIGNRQQGGIIMTETIQPRSWETVVHVTNNDLHIQKPETKDTMDPLLTLSNNLNNLYENINKLNYMLKNYVNQTKKLEQILDTIKVKEE